MTLTGEMAVILRCFSALLCYVYDGLCNFSAITQFYKRSCIDAYRLAYVFCYGRSHMNVGPLVKNVAVKFYK